MRNAKATLQHLIKNGTDAPMSPDEQAKLEALGKYRENYIAHMDDDLNTADAISDVFELIREINTDVKDGCSREFAKAAWALLDELTEVLGLLRADAEEAVDDDVMKLVEERQAARKAKDFATADRIRDELAARGITLKDTPQGVQIIRS